MTTPATPDQSRVGNTPSGQTSTRRFAYSRPAGSGSGAASDAVLVTGIGELATCAGADGTIAVDAAASVAQRLGLLRDAAVEIGRAHV